ncbi:MAG TPA: PLP-dependent aminotransferase family protein [Bacteroidales bacterium]|nr:PLP-dependent aminotransferase family protein [Bacteroidales bacterium]
MSEKFERFYSSSSQNMKRSAIREILKLTQKPGMISFAGGLPSPDSFPLDDIKKIAIEVLEEQGKTALQYGTTEGDLKLRRLLAERHNKQGLSVTQDNIVITTGSQQALDLLPKIFINPGDYIICGLPSYLGGLNAFSAYGAKLRGIPLDNNGMIPDELEKAIIELESKGEKVKFIYIIPDFQNPAGVTVPGERRLEIIRIAKRHNLLIVEDSPYREVRFDGEEQPLMYSLDDTGIIITLNTFSKIFAPGFRLAWVVADPEIIDKIVVAKQSTDLCSPVILQNIAAKYIEKGLLDINLEKIISLYRDRRNYMIKCLHEEMPEGVSWTEPQGGLFLFVTLPPSMDSAKLLERAIKKNVAFVCGNVFFCNDEGHNTMRINFSYSCFDEIKEGVKRLADSIREEMQNC